MAYKDIYRPINLPSWEWNDNIRIGTADPRYEGFCYTGATTNWLRIKEDENNG